MPDLQRFDRVDAFAVDAIDDATGWLKVPARITRAGIFDYPLDDGTIRRELRHPDFVFAPESMDSLQMVPVTLGHPREFLDANSTRDHQVGFTGQEIERRDDFVVAPLAITDHTTINAIKAGLKEVSAGYSFAGLEMTGGVYDGQPYDAIQIGPYKYNHVAIVPKGRAGPDVKVLDSADCTRTDEETMTKLKIGDDEFEVPKAVADAYGAMCDKLDAFAKKSQDDDAAAKTEDDDAAAKTEDDDAAKPAEDGYDDATKKSDAAATFAAGFAAGKTRVDLEGKVATVLGTGYDFTGKTNAAIRADALKVLAPDVSVDGRSEDYIAARLDAAIETRHMDAYKPLGSVGKPGDTMTPVAKALAEYDAVVAKKNSTR
jgi:hypothetical protein